MSEIDRILAQLESPNADKRFDACELLRVSNESSEAIVNALIKVMHDQNPDVADAAKRAFEANAHHQMAIKLGLIKGEPELISVDPNATKRCPFCGEEILAVAVVCKHCGRDLSPQKKSGLNPAIVILLVIIGIVATICFLANMGSGSKAASTLKCTSEQQPLKGITGFSLGTSDNVIGTLKQSSGSIIAPDLNRVQNGVQGQIYTSAPPGSYVVEIKSKATGSVVDTYDVTVQRNEATMLIVVCK